MFTGIIEEVGTVKKAIYYEKSGKIIINCKKILNDINIGDSIAVNGVCLTVTEFTDSSFTADVMTESIRLTNLSLLSYKSEVNLERAMQLNGRFGGHIVTGHIDGQGYITNLKEENNAVWVTVSTETEILKYIVKKGSITIDGISLTVAYVDDTCFKVSVIPHTKKETTLLNKKVGSCVNIENDIISKYIEKFNSNNNNIKNNDIKNENYLNFLNKCGY